LKPVVKSERENGEAYRERGDRDISAIMDIYENARRRCSNARASRDTLAEYRRTGKRVRTFTGLSPLFLLVYLDKAETVIYALSHISRRDTKRTDNRTLALVATKILQRHPTRFVRFLTRLAEEAEREIRSDRLANMYDIWNIARRKDDGWLREH
ncbi:hypothetical protein C8A01DRAFT_20727, partial [Parachaetomium inaequale]